MRNLLIVIFCILSIVVFIGANNDVNNLQLIKEKELVNTLKKLLKCKNMGVYEEGDLYCSLSFRGLQIDFAGVNSRRGGSIYIKSIGPNQTVGTRGRHCIIVIFGDNDLRGVIDAHILFRDNGVITHNHNNENAWAECQ
jgi:hypothetical protein